MAHTIEDLIINIADKYSEAETKELSCNLYVNNKAMLWEFVEKLHHPAYIEKLQKSNYKEL